MSGFAAPVRLSQGRQRIAAGKTHVRQHLLRIFAAVDSIEYDVAAAWVRRELTVLEVDLRFTRGDHAYVQLPVTIVLRLADGLISEVQFWTCEAAVNGRSRVA